MTSNPARSTCRPAFTARAEFAATEFMHDEREDDYTGFAPTPITLCSNSAHKIRRVSRRPMPASSIISSKLEAPST